MYESAPFMKKHACIQNLRPKYESLGFCDFYSVSATLCLFFIFNPLLQTDGELLFISLIYIWDRKQLLLWLQTCSLTVRQSCLLSYSGGKSYLVNNLTTNNFPPATRY